MLNGGRGRFEPEGFGRGPRFRDAVLGVRSRMRRQLRCEKESADTQKYESCQLIDMEVDMDDNKEESRRLHSQCGEQFGRMA